MNREDETLCAYITSKVELRAVQFKPQPRARLSWGTMPEPFHRGVHTISAYRANGDLQGSTNLQEVAFRQITDQDHTPFSRPFSYDAENVSLTDLPLQSILSYPRMSSAKPPANCYVLAQRKKSCRGRLTMKIGLHPQTY